MRVVCLLTLALLAGCGQKGPLYFAPKEPAKAAPPTQQATPAADREDDNDDSDQD
ncbi:LPS translocon maturation chaperone LptM [Alloalcanivorax mobilis]|uniref:LPS translocon maturation chaperone LptM n=1 Tax=Alloalcanivorax mobilis TaxID=2019569 RepID=UPI000C77224B